MNAKKDELKEKRGYYRLLFLHGGTGPVVLGDILAGPCRFFDAACDQETGVRQAVAREILSLMDIWVGEGQTATPETFVKKLSVIAEEDGE